ncbi:MAG: DUF4922 domain-containing protein [Prolixibacteraceae bacterium]|nr:DUF4922 domain-containing protein [Prolixibacteraceae bacterium]
MESLKKHLVKLPATMLEANWDEKIEFLYTLQKEDWLLAYNNYIQFDEVKKRAVNFDFFKVEIQHNPARKRSTCADLSAETIKERPCFLCASNLPKEQVGFTLLDKYLLLINPYPIFAKHLTISSLRHTPQRISGRITDMLSLSKKLKNYTIFYNGPLCGASAPDHFHFQAAEKDVMPIDFEIDYLKEYKTKILVEENDIHIFQSLDYSRNVIVFEAEYIEPIDYFFEKVYNQLPFDETSKEPMLNLLANYENGKYRLSLFPRKQQRPSCYFEENEKQIMVSPASVEMGGIIVTPREEDFQKIKKSDIEKIYAETSLDFSINDILNI